MIICGLKLTHDGAVSLIDNNKLVFSVEMEKINNNLRFSEISDLNIIPQILNSHGYSLNSVDLFAIDGWEGLNESSIKINNNGIAYTLPVAPYREEKASENILQDFGGHSLKIGADEFKYSSYMHVAGHVFSAYCTSPFAAKKEDSYVMVWDGGMFPRLYCFDALNRKVINLGKLFYLIGNFYCEFSMYFEPFKSKKKDDNKNLSIAGKVMAYIAKGSLNEDILRDFNKILDEELNISMDYVHEFSRVFIKKSKGKNYKDEDVLATLHVFLENLLVESLKEKVSKNRYSTKNICLVGGCALNIKWNSAVRNSQIFENVWIPPFPNDSGSAIGAACCAMLSHSGRVALEWSVYSGPCIIANDPSSGWEKKPCSIKELAELLYQSNEPVVFLNGKAELGPRALGNRSIIGAATCFDMKNKLNKAKDREDYRPVAPICLEDQAATVFSPGVKDPYMLFDHFVKDEWKSKVSAICHLDGTARVQTISKEDHPIFYSLLLEYHLVSGIPLLCNTSANFNGKGFFPDVFSATDWGKLNYVWCEDMLYTKS
jgi:carbamoyltransferase